MFSKKSKSNDEESIPSSASIIGAGNVITGDITSNADLRVDGTVKGNVYAKAKVLIGPSGQIEGSLFCKEADVAGTICGNISSEGLLVLKGNASVEGDIQTSKLLMEPSVSFNGQCRMGANVVELKQELPMAVNE